MFLGIWILWAFLGCVQCSFSRCLTKWFGVQFQHNKPSQVGPLQPQFSWKFCTKVMLKCTFYINHSLSELRFIWSLFVAQIHVSFCVKTPQPAFPHHNTPESSPPAHLPADTNKQTVGQDDVLDDVNCRFCITTSLQGICHLKSDPSPGWVENYAMMTCS